MSGSLFSPTFVIGHIRIGTVEGASCVNLGNNWPTDFKSHKKQNQGFGSVDGDSNRIQGIRAYLDDADLIDMFNQVEQTAPGEKIKTESKS